MNLRTVRRADVALRIAAALFVAVHLVILNMGRVTDHRTHLTIGRGNPSLLESRKPRFIVRPDSATRWTSSHAIAPDDDAAVDGRGRDCGDRLRGIDPRPQVALDAALAALHADGENECRRIVEAAEGIPLGLLSGGTGPPTRRSRRLPPYHAVLRRKYDLASRRPWFAVEPDPPQPR